MVGRTIGQRDASYESVIDRNVMEMLETWVNGNRSEVIDNLSKRHPAITAMFLVTGSHERMLTIGDCNSVTNQLNDNLIEIRDSEGIEATHRPWNVTP